MRKFELGGENGCVYYISSKCRACLPAKTVLVFAPDRCAASGEAVSDFARSSGWADAAERDGAVLVLPIAPGGWKNESTDRIKPLYKRVWRDTESPDPHEFFQNVWCWETLIFAVGYDEGAVFAGNAAVDHPNAFAEVAMVNGAPDDYAGGERSSDGWLLPDAPPERRPRNREIPVAVRFLGNADTAEAVRYFLASAAAPDEVEAVRGRFGPDPDTTELLLREFGTRVRWKNSPDGTPARLKPEALVRADGEYIPDAVECGGTTYNYYTRLPRGAAGVRGLPVVVSLHGRGEPAWMFAQKNGWPELQDETGGFVFVCPDSPGNIWTIERDEDIHAKIIERLRECFGVDTTRVYLTGFSNGALATCWHGERHPELFAALSPWNSPISSYERNLTEGGWEMPMFAVNGDLDHKMDLPRRGYKRLFETFIKINGGVPRRPDGPAPWPWEPDEIWSGADRYTREAGYAQGERLTTWVYRGGGGRPRFCFTTVRDMPHGAIHDEARAAWDFLRRFSRPERSRRVVDSGEASAPEK